MKHARSEAEVRKEAVAWYARLCSGGATESDREAWRHWHRAHPDHQRAWQRFEAMQATLSRVPGHLAASALRAAQSDRRRVLRGIAALAGGGSMAWLSWRVAGSEGWLADYRTATGEQRTVTLADGSQLMLNTRTSVDVAIDSSRRLVTLRDGEILVQTAKHRGVPGVARKDSRPFMVETPHGRVLALGTRFTVRSDGARTVVSVLEAAVEVRALRAPGEVVRLEAGQQAGFTGERIDAPRPADPALAEWEHGSLVVNDWRLEDVVGELARYRRGRLACDLAIADIRVSGAFPVMDTDKALAVIARAFPAVRVTSATRYWVSIVPA